MIIGIDLDGVLYDTEHWLRTYGELYDIEKHGQGMIDITNIRMSGRYDWDIPIRAEFFERYLAYAQINAPLFVGARQVIDQLRADGHKIVIITGRGSNNQPEIDRTLARLADDGIVYDSIHFGLYNKLQTCLDEKLDVMIDDLTRNIEELSQGGVPCIYVKYLSAKKIDSPLVTEVSNWGEIYRELLKMMHA